MPPARDPEIRLVRPYGDRRDDGVVQLSFVLPVPVGDRAREAAAELARRMGLEQVLIATMERAADGYAFFVVYGRIRAAVDWSALEVPEVTARNLGFDELNALIARDLGRRIVIVGACTGSDAHAVGIDAIMNMKGYAGHKGLEAYPWIDAHNLGAQVDNAVLISKARELSADAILVSQIITQRDVHIDNSRQMVDLMRRQGLR